MQKKALAEYIWNGFDAGASSVNIEFEADKLGGVRTLHITDNGHGIDYQRLDKTFLPVFESEKDLEILFEQRRKVSAIHGKTGIGRLTFFSFAQHATWYTVYRDREDKKTYQYTIKIDAETLNHYEKSSSELSQYEVGTSVVFTGIRDLTIYDFETAIPEYLAKCFGWYLELNVFRDFSLTINDEILDYSWLVGDRESFQHEERGNESTIIFRYSLHKVE